MEPTIATIIGFGGNFAPRAWAFCHGQLLAISSNDALFSILGTIYGGDGRTTFGLPDLRGRAMIGAGNGPGLSDRRLGAKGGQERVTLNTGEIPAHNHTATLHAEAAFGTENLPEGNMLARSAPLAFKAYGTPNANDDHAMGSGSVLTQNTGGNIDHENMMPFLANNYIICLYGVYPSRS